MTDPLVGVEILMYNTGERINKAINNCGEHVDRIYVGYSEYNWGYNGKRNKNKTGLEIIEGNRYKDKIRIIEGKWEKDEDSRNACLRAAREDGMEYLVMQDADEYYRGEDYEEILRNMIRYGNEGFNKFKINMLQFWKDWEHILVGQYGNKVTLSPDFGIRIGSDSRFMYSRITNHSNVIHLGGICYHGTLVMNDEEVKDKINNWGHAGDFNRERWYNEKWKGWESDNNIRDLHYFKPETWNRTEKWEGYRPE